MVEGCISERRERAGRPELASLLDKALRFYGIRILDNVDLDRLPDLRSARGGSRLRDDGAR